MIVKQNNNTNPLIFTNKIHQCCEKKHLRHNRILVNICVVRIANNYLNNSP